MKAPFQTTKSQRSDMLITLLAVFVLPIYFYGLRVVIMLGFAVLTSLVIEFAAQKIFSSKRKQKFAYDSTSLITAMICTLLLSAAAPHWLVCAAVALSLIIGKYPFGGTGKNIFNPAAIGLSFVGLCWPELTFSYPSPHVSLPLFGDVTVPLVNSPEYQLGMGGVPQIRAMDALLGQFAGPIGATVAIVLFACGVYMLIRRSIKIYIPAALLITTSVISLLVPRIHTTPSHILMFEFISGVLLFGSVFMANDPSTIPRSRLGQVYFGIFLGFFTMLFKYFGINEFDFIYALLIANAMSDLCDKLAHWSREAFLRFSAKGEPQRKEDAAV